MTLVAHLRRQSGFLCDARELARFPDIVRERLFAIDVITRAHRKNGDVRVQVVRCAAEHGIERLLLLQHDAEVPIDRRLREALDRGRGPVEIDVAQRNDVLRSRSSVEVRRALAAASDRGDIQLVVERFVSERSQRWHAAIPGRGYSSCEQRSEEEMASGEE